MITTTATLMPTDPKLLTLVQWMSPAFPIGGFAYSHGLESAIAEGWVQDRDTLEGWLRDCLREGSGRSDAIWLRCSYEVEDPRALNQMARAYVLGAERLRETDRLGAAFVSTVNAVWDLDMPDLILPVAVGHAARREALDLEAVVVLYLQAFVSNLVSAAVRLFPLGQTAGQSVVRHLQQDCLDVATSTVGLGAEDVRGNTFLSDIAAMKHETLEPRLFQS